MINKTRRLFFLLAILQFINILILLFLFFYEKLTNKYLYPQLSSLNISQWLFLFLLLMIFDVIILAIVALMLSKKTLKKAIAILLILLLIPYSLICVTSFFLARSNWKSYTDNESDFGVIDRTLEDNLKIADTKFSDIIKLDRRAVYNYEYEFKSDFLVQSFNISFDIKFSEESYYILKEEFSASSKIDDIHTESVVTPYGDSIEVMGVFKLLPQESFSFIEWEKFSIAYNDSTQMMYFELIGLFEI